MSLLLNGFKSNNVSRYTSIQGCRYYENKTTKGIREEEKGNGG